jgi:hypothetical protein
MRTVHKLKMPPDYGYNFSTWIPILFALGARNACGNG